MNAPAKTLPARFKAALGSLGGGTFLAGAAMAACFLAMGLLPSLRGPYVTTFLACFAIAALAYAFAVLRLRCERMPITWLWVFAVIFRLPLLFTTPTLSDDVYRNIWDGHLVASGVNPYAEIVSSPELDTFAIPERELVNHDWMASPYLPAAQVYFGLVSILFPGSPSAFQVGAALLDLLTGWLVMDLLRRLSLPPHRGLIYLWNPLVVIEFAHGAHIDALMIASMTLAIWLLARAELNSSGTALGKSLSALALGLSALTKGLPALAAPIFARHWGWRRTALFALTVAGGLALFAFGAGWGLTGPMDGRGVFGALRIYNSYWNFNSGIYHWLEVILSGYRTPGGVPFEAATAGAIQRARLISNGLIVLAISAVALFYGLRRDKPSTPRQSALRMIRTIALPFGVFLLLTHTVHPWYLTLMVPFLPFWLPAEEFPGNPRFVWAWVYLSCTVSLSYLTYIDLQNLREFGFVRWIEYIPTYLLLLAALGESFYPGLTRIWETGTYRERMKHR